MTPFEEELKKALSRREPSLGFKARVLQSATQAQLGSRPAIWLRFTTLAALFLLLATGLTYRQHVRNQKGEAAKQQLLVAMRIAGGELRQAQERVRQSSTNGMVMQ